MKTNIIVIYLLSLFFIDCSNSTGPNSDLEFSKMEIHYTKVGGWINTSKLDVYGNSLVSAYLISQAALDIMDSSSTLLNEEEQNKMANLFMSFYTYDSKYEPKQWYTDGNLHIIIFVYEEKADTVTVYEPHNSNIPNGLNEIIQEMESLWKGILN